MNTCPLCDSSETNLFKKNVAYNSDLIRCSSCKVIYALPFKAPEMDFYTNAQDASSEERHTKLYPFPKRHPVRKCEYLYNGNERRILDIGCGNGAFLSFVSENNFHCLGLDLDKASLAIAQKRKLKNTDLKNCTLSNLCNNSEYHHSFDVITMFEVFEHLDNPNETIEFIKLLLKPEGYFIGSLPNINRFWMWQYNMNYELPPYHLTYWALDSWSSYLENKGFAFILGENTNYFGYISDVLRLNYLKGEKNTVLKKITSLIFEGVKKFIETPIERVTARGAGFIFISQLK